jgi:hypothetical protein
MGTFERLPPFTAKQGQMWTNRKGKFEVTSPAGRQLIFYPSRMEVDVLHNSRTRLDEVTCAS